jgi:hypothetical protein
MIRLVPQTKLHSRLGKKHTHNATVRFHHPTLKPQKHYISVWHNEMLEAENGLHTQIDTECVRGKANKPQLCLPLHTSYVPQKVAGHDR